MGNIIGVDVGGTLLRAALFDPALHLLKRAEQATAVELGPDRVLERLYETIREVMPENAENLAGIGVALPGPLDSAAETLIIAPNLPFKGEVPIRKLIQQALGGEVYLGNDADLAGLAENQMGAGRGTRHMVYITVSTGIGGGILIDGRPYNGRGQGAEIGHMAVSADGPLCGCGKRGHLEAFSSGTAMVRAAQDRIGEGAASSILDLAGRNSAEITARTIGDAAKQGDSLACEIVSQAGRYLGISIASLMMLLNPEMFVLGGSVIKIGELLFEPMRAAIREVAMVPRYWQDTPIVPAQLGDDAGLIGAAALVRLKRQL